MKKRWLLSFVLIIALVLVVYAIGYKDGSNPNEGSAFTYTQVSTSSRELLTATEASEKVLPSIVAIMSYEKASDINAYSEGSGIIISSDGYIVSNAHVIEGMEMVKIITYDDEVYTATSDSFWYDIYTDLAVIKIDANNLSAAELGKSSELRIAQDVLAIGNPGGIQFKSSVSKGIISSLAREYEPIEGSGYVINCLQTDAAINPGNSGGALVNLYGQVIGINSAKISDVSYEGIGFSISIDDALPIINELIEKGYVGGRAALGVSGGTVSVYILDGRSIKSISGFYITEINNQSLINQGIQLYDIITEVNGKTVTSQADTFSALRGLSSGDMVNITVYRLGDAHRYSFYYYYDAEIVTANIELIEYMPLQ